MKLYGALASPYVARVVMFARLKGLDLKPQMPEHGIRSAAYLALNPMGRMPTLEVNGQAVPESEVICEFLDEEYPDRGGMPQDTVARAHVRVISRVHDLYVAPHATALFRNLNPAHRDAGAVAAATEGLVAGFGHLEHFVTANPFAAGGALTMADCTLLPSIALLRRAALPAFGIADPAEGERRLAQWWHAVSTDAFGGAFLAEYMGAVEGFLKMLSGGGRG